MAKTFLVSSDDTINSYGFRVLTSGIDTKSFLKNPIGLFNHQRYDDWSTEYSGPIVQWSNLQFLKEGLHADAEIDTEDPKGKVINNKVEKGFLRGASIGIRIIETSEDPKLMLPGQKYPTVTRCELREISIVDIPSNPNALALYDNDGNKVELKSDEDVMVHLSAFQPKTQQQVNNMFKLKLPAGLTALASWFKVEPGKDHEVELSSEQLETLNSQIGELEKLRGEKSKSDADLKLAQDKVQELTTELQSKNKTITDHEAEIKRLGDVAAGANGEGGKGAANKDGAEGGGEGAPKNEFLSDVDAKVKAMREEIYGKEEVK